MNGTRLVNVVAATTIVLFSALLARCDSEQGGCVAKNTGTFTFQNCTPRTNNVEVDGSVVVRNLSPGDKSDPVRVIANVDHSVVWHDSDGGRASFTHQVSECSNKNLRVRAGNYPCD